MNDATSTSTYVFDHSWQRERDRMRAIESLFDPSSKRLLSDRGVGPGWRCLELGCGAGGIATWLADQVGGTGGVVAVDLDTRFVDTSGRDNLELRQQDILSGQLEEGEFDLVHGRAVVEHIPERERAIERLVAALKPGGWMLLEDVDFGGPMAAAASRYIYPPQFGDLGERLFRAVEIVFAAAGAEGSYGPRLPGALQEAGLVNVSGEVRAPIVQGGSEQWVRGTAEQLAPRLVQTGLVTEHELQSFLKMASEQTSHYVPPFMAAAWGEKR